jgi:large conductance mechanosensitive channel
MRQAEGWRGGLSCLMPPVSDAAKIQGVFMGFWSEFKKFVMRGNVIDLAIGFVIGVAFSKIITSLVDGIIMPLIGLLLGGINIANKTFTVGQAVVKWGSFLQNILEFLIIAFSVFMVIKLLTLLKIKSELPPGPSAEEKLLIEIRDLLKK